MKRSSRGDLVEGAPAAESAGRWLIETEARQTAIEAALRLLFRHLPAETRAALIRDVSENEIAIPQRGGPASAEALAMQWERLMNDLELDHLAMQRGPRPVPAAPRRGRRPHWQPPDDD